MRKFTDLEPLVFKLDEFEAISITGTEATDFLNSQTTNSVSSMDSNTFQFDALLDISGKLESFFITLKKTVSEFILLVPSKIYDDSFKRIQKFHIIEDVNFSKIKHNYVLKFFNKKNNNDFNGLYGNLEATIGNLEDEKEIEKQINFNDLSTLLQVPILDKTIKLNEIINNTLLSEIAVNYNKGCFIGQETVSKINSRRGAAKAPLFLESKEELKLSLPCKAISHGQSIGEISYKISFKDKCYYLAFLNRENRIENKDIFLDVNSGEQVKTTTKNFPLINKDLLCSNLYQSAVIDFQQSNEDLAIKKLKRIINLDSNYHDAYESLGVIYGRQERFEDAIKVMHELEKNAPKSVMAQTNLSMFYMKIGEIEKAETHKSNATINQFAAFGDIADEKRAKEEAEKKKVSELKRREEMFLQVLAIDNKDPLANFGLGELRLTQGNLEEAKKLLTVTIGSDPKYSVAYLALAKVLIEQKKLSHAKDILKEGIDVASKNGDLMPANEMQSLFLGLKI